MTFYSRIRTVDRILIRPKRFGSDRIRNTACTPNYSSWTKLTPPPFISPVFVRPLAALKNLFFKVFNTVLRFSPTWTSGSYADPQLSAPGSLYNISVLWIQIHWIRIQGYVIIFKKKKKIILESNNFLNKKYLYNQKNFLVSWFSIWWIYVLNLTTFVSILS